MSAQPDPYTSLIAEYTASAKRLQRVNHPLAKTMARSLWFAVSVLQNARVR
ncbi:MAG: hypothetical protein K6T83_17335 [Alicyclobacillus sp.]|nr:hypothetical protein [Alicyclobacillus sp.]